MTRDELLLRLSMTVSDAELQRLRAELADEPEDAPGWLHDLAKAADVLPLPLVPPVLAHRLRQMFHGPTAAIVCDAEVLDDSRGPRQLVGSRSPAESSTDTDGSWTVVFGSTAGDLVVDVWPTDGGRFDVETQLLGPAEGPQTCQVRWEGPTSERVDGDELGRSRLAGLAAGSYRLTVDNGCVAIHALVDLA